MIAVTKEKMQELEALAIKKLNIPSILLMEDAAYGFVFALMREVCDISSKKICVICGKGNNGGDGYAIARLLHFLNMDVCVFSPYDKDTLSGDAKANCDMVKAAKIPFTDTLENFDIIVDALFGTGFHSSVTPDIKELIDSINKSGAYVASVDIPSGLSAETGQGESYVCADLCVSFGYAKCGHFIYPAKGAYKKLVISPISIPLPDESIDIITQKTFFDIPKRDKNSHKGSFGKVLAFVGSYGMAGAAILSANAVLKSGAGMVTVATEDTLIPSLSHRFPSVMTYGLKTLNGELSEDTSSLILKKATGMDSVLIGPGLGMSKGTQNAVIQLVKKLEIPTVVDADGLNILSKDISILNDINNDLILTPHIAEFARLSSYSIDEIKKNPINLAKEFAKKYKLTLILKDAVTIIADKDERVAICPAENSGMATAGSGDVLAGVVVSLLSQGIAPFDASRLAVYIHAASGKICAKTLGEYGMTSTDILNNVPLAFMKDVDISPSIKEL